MSGGMFEDSGVTGVVHIVVAMKPMEGSFSENALRYGVAGLNIDGSRVGTDRMSVV